MPEIENLYFPDTNNIPCFYRSALQQQDGSMHLRKQHRLIDQDLDSLCCYELSVLTMIFMNGLSK